MNALAIHLSLAMVLMVPAAATLAADAPQPETEVLRKLQGHWKAEKWVIHGTETSEGRDNRSYRVEGRRMLFVTDGKDIGAANFKIEVSEEPFEMDVTYVGGPRDGQTLLGIFRFDDGKLINCFSYPGNPRPTSFESTTANRCFLSIDRRKGE